MERLDLSQQLAREVLDTAKAKGATQGDIVMVEGDSFFVTVRLGEVEKISQAQEKRLGLRLFYGNSSASASTSDISRQAIDKLLEDTISMARFTAQDPFSGLPEASLLARNIPDMDLFDDAAGSGSVDDKIAIALAAEKAAMEFDPRITTSEGAAFSNQTGRVIYASSRGCSSQHTGTDIRH